MKQIILLAIILVFSVSISIGQTDEDQKLKDYLKRRSEVQYYAPVRYVIVYNWILDKSIPERRMDILMDEKQFNKENLEEVFQLIKKRFPLPMSLDITVHTNLATIETPEEFEMLKDSVDSRFSHTYSKYKKASYSRWENGREAYNYTISLSPYKEKLIVLNDIEF